MKRTLLTGAAGFTGRYVGELLARHGHEVHGLVLDRRSGAADFGVMHSADICDPETLWRVVSEVRPHHVVHLAAIPFVGHSDIERMYRVNISGTRNLLHALTELSEKPDSILLASSANVYGNAHSGLLDEGMRPAPANDYAVTKVAMEYVASIFAAELPLIVTRPFNYTGRGQGPDFLIPKVVQHALEGATTIELGNLAVARDFSDVRTVADAYVRLLDTAGAIGQTFNVCSGHAVALRDIIQMVERISGHKLEIRVNPALVRANEVQSLCGSATKIESAIGPLKQIALEGTLQWMLDE